MWWVQLRLALRSVAEIHPILRSSEVGIICRSPCRAGAVCRGALAITPRTSASTGRCPPSPSPRMRPSSPRGWRPSRICLNRYCHVWGKNQVDLVMFGGITKQVWLCWTNNRTGIVVFEGILNRYCNVEKLTEQVLLCLREEPTRSCYADRTIEHCCNAEGLTNSDISSLFLLLDHPISGWKFYQLDDVLRIKLQSRSHSSRFNNNRQRKFLPL